MRSPPEYDLALSFAGEDRELVERCAQLLRDVGYRVFYDRWEQHDLWGKDLTAHLDSVYRGKARYCLVFISKHYVAKAWTRHELRSAQARAMHDLREYILPARLDDTPVPGLPENVGYLDLRTCSVEELVRLVERKLGSVQAPKDLDQLLHGANPEERIRGLRLAARKPEPHHVERMLELLRTDTEARVRATAAMMLRRLGEPRAKEGFLAALEDPDWEVRVHAGWGLVHLGDAVREDVLAVIRTSKDPATVQHAQLILGKL
jgi:TIR domain-containing protein/HEAT repeat protein